MRVFRDFADLLQQREILHVARAHLQAIHIGMHQFSMSRVHNFCEGLQAVLFAASLHDLQALFTQTLEGMRVGAWLDRATANPCKTQISDTFRNLEELLFGLHGTRTCVDGDLVCFSTVIGKIGEWFNHGSEPLS